MAAKRKLAADEMYCSSCGKLMKKGANTCPWCGVRREKAGADKSPELAVLLSFIWPGLGQIYNGDAVKGIVLLIASSVFAVFSFLLIGLPFYMAVWFYAMYDGYKRAEQIRASSTAP